MSHNLEVLRAVMSAAIAEREAAWAKYDRARKLARKAESMYHQALDKTGADSETD